MPLVKILQDYSPAEGWVVGEVVDIAADVSRLIAEGKVELVEDTTPEVVEPVEIKPEPEIETSIKSETTDSVTAETLEVEPAIEGE